MRRWLTVLLLLASVALVHWPGPDAGFTYDDRDFVETNGSIRSPAGALAAFALPCPPDQPGRALYRPLSNASYALDHAIWGLWPRGFHLTNVALYAAVVILVHRLALASLGSAGFAFAVALLFSVHPVHTEAVDAVAGRSELLSLTFALVGLLLFLKIAREPKPRGAALWGSVAAYTLACLSKESGAVWLVVLAVQRWALCPPAPGSGPVAWLRGLRPLLPHLAVFVVYALVRGSVLGQLTPDTALLRDSGLVTRLATMGTVFALNLGLLVWPAVLQVDFYYQAALGIPTALKGIALAGCCAALMSLFLAGRLALLHFGRDRSAPVEKRREREAALAAFAIFFATLLPTSHLLDIGALMAERFLLAPSLGFLLLAVLAGRHLMERHAPGTSGLAAAWTLVALLAVAGAWRSHLRAVEWRDPVSLWRATALVLDDKRVYLNLATSHLARGEREAARLQLERALSHEPDYLPALGNLGAIALYEDRLDEAETLFRRILEREPRTALAWYNLGVIELRRGHADRAEAHFRRALEIEPNHAWARAGLEAVSQAGSDAPAQGSR